MFKKGGTALDVTVVHETNKPDLLEEECKENVLKYSLLIRALKASDKTVMVVKIHSFPLEGRGKWFMGNEKVMRELVIPEVENGTSCSARNLRPQNYTAPMQQS